MVGSSRQALLAAVMVLSMAAIGCILFLGNADGPYSLMSKDGSQMSDKQELLSKLRGILKSKVDKQHEIGSKVKAWVAASGMKEHEPLALAAKHWKALRSDWKPYNPSLSLAQNVAEVQQDGDAREQQLSEMRFVKKAAKPSIPHPKGEARHAASMDKVIRYESHYHHAGGAGGWKGANGCSDWGAHPLACIRQAYHNHLKATKFASLRRKYDGSVTQDALDHERNVIANKVSEGLVEGKLAVPKHGPVKRWVKAVKENMHKERQDELKAAVRKEAEEQAKEESLHDIARDWGSGIAGSGPDAGRRYYVNYATGKTAFSAPAYVKQALKQLRVESKERELKEVKRDAALYKEGFEAAQRADTTGTAGFAPIRPVQELSGVRRAEQTHASAAINRFLSHHGRALKPNHYTTDDLAAERKRVAHELGLKSLTHGGALTQQLSNLPIPLADKTPKMVIVDPYGRPITSQPSGSQYPGMGNGEFMDKVSHQDGGSTTEGEAEGSSSGEQAGEAQGEATSGGEESSGEAKSSSGEGSAVASEIKAVAKASAEHEAALQAEVRAQTAIIKDLEAKMEEVVSSKDDVHPRAVRPDAAAAAPRRARGRRESRPQQQAQDEKPPLGSWEMAKFANNVDAGQGGLGTNIAYMYDDLSKEGPYRAVANGEAEAEDDSDRNFAVDREEVARAEAKRVQEDVAKVKAEAQVFGGDKEAARAEHEVNRALERERDTAAAYTPADEGTIGSVAPIPLTGEGYDEAAPQARRGVRAEAAEEEQGSAEQEAAPREEEEEGQASGAASEEEEGDDKPPLTSFEMAKFANNVDSGLGALGTNVVWMYKDLAAKGPYKAVENGDVQDEDEDEEDEYKAKVPSSVLHQIKAIAPQHDMQHLDKVASRQFARIVGSMGDSAQQI
eukprot:CAMPEP_0181322356 /NCGR_PEP_ID=MMETSP1101-20121128/19186_1 /TAXON_ID=46948 /ORGANISM="Rhodomonas abbreviata, Strain Caron Lab Isolate" /LENGTH=901 /DNA_ID=CAMNT_0023430267 /DNA_START=13 /DNA_END=2718 /DNA_ORIENTATION=-